MAGSQHSWWGCTGAGKELLEWGSQHLTKGVRRIWASWSVGEMGMGGGRDEARTRGQWGLKPRGVPPHPHLRLETPMGSQGRAPLSQCKPRLQGGPGTKAPSLHICIGDSVHPSAHACTAGSAAPGGARATSTPNPHLDPRLPGALGQCSPPQSTSGPAARRRRSLPCPVGRGEGRERAEPSRSRRDSRGRGPAPVPGQSSPWRWPW